MGFVENLFKIFISGAVGIIVNIIDKLSCNSAFGHSIYDQSQRSSFNYNITLLLEKLIITDITWVPEWGMGGVPRFLQANIYCTN